LNTPANSTVGFEAIEAISNTGASIDPTFLFPKLMDSQAMDMDDCQFRYVPVLAIC